MKMTDLANLLMMTAEVHGDRDVVLVEEGTGEVRYVQGISFDSHGEDVHLEHVGWDELTLMAKFEELEQMIAQGQEAENELARMILEELMKEMLN